MLSTIEDRLKRLLEWGFHRKSVLMWAGAAIVAGLLWFVSVHAPLPSKSGWDKLAPDNAQMRQLLDGQAAAAPTAAVKPATPAPAGGQGATASAAASAVPDPAAGTLTEMPPETTPGPTASDAAAAAAGKVRLNSASLQALMSLPGIGPSKAQAIVDYRTKNGGFKKPDDLMKVKGIGPKTYERLQPLIAL
ncbi:MAG: helix-hairpin-helix domain-containing protein [Paenibacillaceae bacterium]|nr:helix-hairpin-helix domain-containing protein [Paenibacillaceae bacterium]